MCRFYIILLCVIVYLVSSTARQLENKSVLSKRSSNIDLSENGKIHEEISKLMNSTNIKDKSRHYSEYPHLPGSKRCKELAGEMAKQWKEYGLDRTEMFKYRALLSFPEKPAEIHLMENDSAQKKLTVKNEPAYSDSEKKGDIVYPFNAFSIPGSVNGELVYVNYGLDEDYEEVEKLDIQLKDKIFLIRYGTPSPRSKLIGRAEKKGAKGVIFYSDPSDYTYDGKEYPKGWMLNKYGVQRGSIYELAGDALSIGYPSKEHYFRENESIYKYQNKIPAQPISAEAAEEIFKFIDGDTSNTPDGFKGELNVSYALKSGNGKTVTLKVHNKLEEKDTYVVCGSLYGGGEPDRYILMGNHRDAWTYGAADPVSGSAAMDEIARALGHYHKKTKYRPRRSIKICSWGAEEAGMIGSTEWADENAHFVSSKVVAYLNVDMAVEGNYTVQIKSLDHMVESIFQASKHVKSPDSDNNLFKDMCKKHAKLDKKTSDLEEPNYDKPGAVSDNKHFSQRYGISVSDYRYIYNKLDFPKLTVHNANYHTLYDSFGWMSKFVDPKFDHHLALGRLWMQHALILADAIVIPFDLTKYAKQVQKLFLELEDKYESVLSQNKVSFDYAKSRLKTLISDTESFHKYVKKVNSSKLDPGKLRSLNDRIMHFEKNFILESNTGKLMLKHIVYSTPEYFYGIVFSITEDPGEDWDNVRKELTLFVWCVDMAIRSMNIDELKMLDS